MLEFNYNWMTNIAVLLSISIGLTLTVTSAYKHRL